MTPQLIPRLRAVKHPGSPAHGHLGMIVLGHDRCGRRKSQSKFRLGCPVPEAPIVAWMTSGTGFDASNDEGAIQWRAMPC
jgi:hypothetical protein